MESAPFRKPLSRLCGGACTFQHAERAIVAPYPHRTADEEKEEPDPGLLRQAERPSGFGEHQSQDATGSATEDPRGEAAVDDGEVGTSGMIFTGLRLEI